MGDLHQLDEIAIDCVAEVEARVRDCDSQELGIKPVVVGAICWLVGILVSDLLILLAWAEMDVGSLQFTVVVRYTCPRFEVLVFGERIVELYT